MAENFDLIFGSSASQSYSWNDSDYQNGWQTVGDTPPTREQFDALQRRNDTKAQELNSRLSPLEKKATADGRQTATAYADGVMVTADGLPNGWLLECIVPGTTGTGALEIPSPLIIGGTIVDGTVTWKLLNLAMGGVPVGYVTPFLQSTAPDGWLSCAGAEISRAAYPDLWNYVNGSSQLISETDWQSKNTAGDINIGWFSSGDGTTTFRLPRIVGSGELTEVKRFTTAGAGTFVAPVTGVYKITLQGAGGGGGGTSNGSLWGHIGGGGGGQGGHGEFYEKLTAGTTYSFTIGAGGTGGVANGASDTDVGTAGGASSITIGDNAYIANGGGGGEGSNRVGSGGAGGTVSVNGVIVSRGASGGNAAGTSKDATTSVGGIGGNGGGNGGGYGGGFYETPILAGVFGGGGNGGGNGGTPTNGGNGGDGYIEFSYNPVPQYWYVRAFGSATNQGTIDITELANMLNAKLSISDVPKIAGFSGKQTFTSSGTFTPTITGNYRITLQGAGGGGASSGNVTGYGYVGGGGGAAGAILEFYEQLTAGTTYSFTIGAGGTGGAANGANGTNGGLGGNSEITIANNTYVAGGGGNGFSALTYHGRGGLGGIGTINGVVVYKGFAGGKGTTGGSTYANGGVGGGVGGANVVAAALNYESMYGGGGAGGDYSGVYEKGSAGGDGYITFEWQSGTI